MGFMLPRGGIRGAASVSPLHLMAPMLLLAVTQVLINTALVATVISLEQGIPVAAVCRNAVLWAGSGSLVGSAAALIVFFVIQHAGVMLFIVILPFPAILYIAYHSALARLTPSRVPQRLR